MSPKLVVVVGDVIDDIVVRPTGPTAYGTDTPSEIRLSPGGSGANQAAWMATLGTSVRFVARAGADGAERHREELEKLGVDARITADPSRPTGTIVVLIDDDGERTMFTDRGASAALDESDMPMTLLDGAHLLHLSGYALFSPTSRAAVLELWQHARDNALDTSVDPNSLSGLQEVGREAFLDWTRGAKLIFPNLDEGRFLAGTGEPKLIVDSLLEYYGTVVLKLGPFGALVKSKNGQHATATGDQGEVVDTTGAGDAFCAGYLASILAGGGLAEAAAAGVRASALAVTRLGARPS